MLIDTLRSQDNFSGSLKDMFVNVAGVTRALKTGDRVRVDGDRGVVERLECE